MDYILVWLLSVASVLCADLYEERFDKIYNEKLWGVNEAGEGFSGGGSILELSFPYYAYLTQFLREHNITSVVDLGCGDWEFSRHIDWSGIEYYGYDVVASVIKKDIQKYANSHIHFCHANFLVAELPTADLVICKHVLQHMPNIDVLKFIKLLPKFKHCLILDAASAFPNVNIDSSVNTTFPFWEDRGTDLTAPPFNIKGKKVLSYENMGVNTLIHIDNSNSEIFLYPQ